MIFLPIYFKAVPQKGQLLASGSSIFCPQPEQKLILNVSCFMFCNEEMSTFWSLSKEAPQLEQNLAPKATAFLQLGHSLIKVNPQYLQNLAVFSTVFPHRGHFSFFIVAYFIKTTKKIIQATGITIGITRL